VGKINGIVAENRCWCRIFEYLVFVEMNFFNYLNRHTFLFVISLVSTHSFGQLSEVDHWEMVVSEGEEWKYLVPSFSSATSWFELDYDDNNWATGATGIGYGDGDDQTLIDPTISLYMRKKFELLDTGSIAYMVLFMDYDDAFVAYLNGKEIARSNISGTPPAYNALANSLHEALLYRGIVPEEFQFNYEYAKSIMREGENILAIEVHNREANSSDLTAIPFLSVGVNDSSHIFQDIPEWFMPPADYDLSSLPILSINTFHNIIADEPRINAWLSVIDHGKGNINSLEDTPTGYDGWISIEIRGESAQMFPKKSYSFETQDSLGENRNVSLLGLPEENDWILYGPYSDKTLIKNVLSYKLARDLGRYATRTRYCEVFINENYMGLYVLMEKIKQDKNRVDIATLRESDISGDQLTGGYIIRVDKLDANDYPSWTAYPEVGQFGEYPVHYQYFDPDGWELQVQQQDYIGNFMKDFEMALNGPYYLHHEMGYKPFVDIQSFVDYMIINELTKNVDAYIFSTYLYKDRDSKGGKLHMGPAWDFNISFGNVDYNNQAVQTYGWLYTDPSRIYFFRRMMNDRIFSNHLNCRWHELRTSVFSNDRMFGYIDSLVNELQGPIAKNFKKWTVLGNYIWPNIFIGNTHAEEISHLKTWLLDRLEWMDDHIPLECITGLDDGQIDGPFVRAYPNPFFDKVRFETNNPENILQIRIFDKEGRLITSLIHDSLLNTEDPLEWSGKSLMDVKAGLYIALIQMMDGKQVYKKLIRE
jgi:hypothetical protein